MRRDPATPYREAKRTASVVEKAGVAVTVRELVGSTRSNGGALMIEKRSRWRCDLCDRSRLIVATVLVPLVKGVSRPRFDTEAQPTVTFCWRCLIAKMLRVALRRAPRVAA